MHQPRQHRPRSTATRNSASRRYRPSIAPLRLFAVAVALSLSLWLTQALAASEPPPPNLRILQPGDNLIGWVGYTASPQDLFDQIPEVELVYTWDAETSTYRFAARGYLASLQTIEPGMGLVVRVAGDDPVEWHQPTVADGEWVPLQAGPNLVAWTGPSGTPIELAVRSIGDSFTHALYANGENSELALFESDSRPGSEPQHQLRRGDGLWVFNTTETSWLQPSGDRALHPLGPPPDDVRWYASFDKHLDADGIAIIATENVADDALFRAAAILDDMLVNRPDIRETLIRQRVHVVVVGHEEQTFDLAPYRQYRDIVKLEPHGPGGPRGLGPNRFTPTLIPEENVLCIEGVSWGYDIVIHEYAHAIDYALSQGASSGNFSSLLGRAYRSGIDSGLWDGSYGATNTAEFWAEAVGAWVGTGQSSSMPFKNRLHLQEHSPLIADLITDTLGDFQVDATCHSAQSPAKGAAQNYVIRGRITDHLGEPLEGAMVWLHQASGTRIARLSPSWPDGGYSLFAEPHRYSMALSIDGCQVTRASAPRAPDDLTAGRFTLTDQDVILDLQLVEPHCTIAASGILLDANGRVVDAYDISVESESGSSRTQPSEDGQFTIRFPDDGTYALRIGYGECDYFYDGAALVHESGAALQFDARQLAAAELNLRLPRGACSGDDRRNNAQ
ncbi:MAG: zinc-dependent peptidase [Chloroflexi bacterium]|nr:zinc-dependent peptidase [Chloroflexota bacterium]